MTRYLLDTNIISEVVKPTPSLAVLEWFADQDDADLYVSTLTVAEIQRGIMDLPDGRRRAALQAWFDGPEGPLQLFTGRVLVFDAQAALAWAELMAEGKAEKRTRSPLDTIIAAVARVNGCVVVTSNTRHFPGIDVLDPRSARD